MNQIDVVLTIILMMLTIISFHVVDKSCQTKPNVVKLINSGRNPNELKMAGIGKFLLKQKINQICIAT